MKAVVKYPGRYMKEHTRRHPEINMKKHSIFS